MTGDYDSLGDVLNLTFSWPYAYVLDQNGLWVVNMNNPASPLLAGFADTTNYAQDVAVAGEYAFIAGSYDGLRVIDISDHANPLEVSQYSLSDAHSVAVSGNYLYVAARLGLHVIDISNPELPIEVGLCAAPSDAVGVAVSGNLAYVSVLDNGLQVIDISDPAQPVEMGFVNLTHLSQRAGGH